MSAHLPQAILTHPARGHRPLSLYRWVLGTVVLILGCSVDCWPVQHDEEVLVFAAASLRNALEQIGVEAEQQGLRPVFNFAGSNVLARQIEATAGGDLLLSANHRWVEHLRQRGHLVESSIRPFLANRLVVIGHPQGSAPLKHPAELATLPFAHLSLADPRAVPAGIYARAFLESVELQEGNLWIHLAGRVAPAADVRAALAIVAARIDVVGIVYHSDAIASRRVKVLYEVPAEHSPDIAYWAAQIADSQSPQAAARFSDLLSTPRAAQIFAQQGFTPYPSHSRSQADDE